MNKNRNLAEKYFIEKGLMPKKEDRTEQWCLHHKDPSLYFNDRERYNEWRPEDLMPMTMGAHRALHNNNVDWNKDRVEKMRKTLTGHTLSPESRAKLSKSMMGNKNGYHKESPETRYKKHLNGLTRQGKKFYNNGAAQRLFVPGTEPDG